MNFIKLTESRRNDEQMLGLGISEIDRKEIEFVNINWFNGLTRAHQILNNFLLNLHRVIEHSMEKAAPLSPWESSKIEEKESQYSNYLSMYESDASSFIVQSYNRGEIFALSDTKVYYIRPYVYIYLFISKWVLAAHV